MPLPQIDPPLLNSANPWATTLQDLQQLFDCPHTGAVTIRTSLLHGFEHDDNIHQYTFFSSTNQQAAPRDAKDGTIPSNFNASLNTLGYSPILLSTYLSIIGRVVADSKQPPEQRAKKPFIISVTGSSEAVLECFRLISATRATVSNPLCMEINLSCPNIPDKSPPAYSGESLKEYLGVLGREKKPEGVVIGVKTPPYTYHDQFTVLINALLASSTPVCPVDFITATNTLGSCHVLSGDGMSPAINSASGAGVGGLAGAPLHPLALGNVRTIRSMLDQHESLREIDVIGVGGVEDKAGYERMKAVGAKVVGVGTALGREGVDVFGKILAGHWPCTVSSR